jgi:hypothetical protein
LAALGKAKGSVLSCCPMPSLRTLAAADPIGVRAILVHAISDGAKTFYERHGFQPSPLEPMTLMITIEKAKRMISG